MNWERLLMAGDQLRPVWRFFLAVAVIILAYVGVGIILGLAWGHSQRPPQVLVSTLVANSLLLPGLLGLSKLLTGAFEGKPLGSVGLRFHRRWKTELGIGVAVGAIMILLVAALEVLLGLASFTWNVQSASRVVGAALFICLLLAIAALNEEITFRGYPFQRLIEAVGAPGAVAISSAVFGLVHLGNPHHTRVSTLNTMLVGVPLAVAYLRTRMLWSSVGLHFTWNFLQGYGLGFPVSGLVFPDAIVRPIMRQNLLLTGGGYGPEGSIITSGVVVLATVYLLVSRSIYMTEETRALVFGVTPTSSPPIVAGSPPGSMDE